MAGVDNQSMMTRNCHFAEMKLHYLGHIINRDGVDIDCQYINRKGLIHKIYDLLIHLCSSEVYTSVLLSNCKLSIMSLSLLVGTTVVYISCGLYFIR